MKSFPFLINVSTHPALTDCFNSFETDGVGKLNFGVFPMDLKKFKMQTKKDVRTQDQMALSDLNESLHWLWFYCRHPPETPYKSVIVI